MKKLFKMVFASILTVGIFGSLLSDDLNFNKEFVDDDHLPVAHSEEEQS